MNWSRLPFSPHDLSLFSYLDKVIHQIGMRSHQYADDTQFYIFTPGPLSDGVEVLFLFWRYSSLDGAMGWNRLQINPRKMKWMLFETSGDKVLSPLVLHRVALPLDRPVCNLSPSRLTGPAWKVGGTCDWERPCTPTTFGSVLIRPIPGLRDPTHYQPRPCNCLFRLL